MNTIVRKCSSINCKNTTLMFRPGVYSCKEHDGILVSYKVSYLLRGETKYFAKSNLIESVKSDEVRRTLCRKLYKLIIKKYMWGYYAMKTCEDTAEIILSYL